MRAIVLVVAIAGCATAPKPHDEPRAIAVEPALQERGAALFDAALHNDRVRLRGVIDWERYRLLDLAYHVTDDAGAARALAALESEPQPSDATIEAALDALLPSLQEIAHGALPPTAQHEIADYLRYNSQRNQPQQWARLSTLAVESLHGERDLIFHGAGDIMLIFVGGQLVAVRRAWPSNVKN